MSYFPFPLVGRDVTKQGKDCCPTWRKPGCAAMCRLALGLAFMAAPFATSAVEFEADVVEARVDLLTVDLAFARDESRSRRSGLYKFIASVALVPASDVYPSAFVSGGPHPGLAKVETRRELDWTERSFLRLTPGADRPYLSPLLSFDAPGQKVNLRLRRHSLSIQYRLDFY
ncbi:MAG: hypothetical protein WCV99_20050 [Sterolibacterium sp.]